MIVHAIYQCDHTGTLKLIELVQHAAKAQQLVDQLTADDTQGYTFWSNGVNVIVEDDITISCHELDAALMKVFADAARYRWLRRQPNDTTAPRIDVVSWTRIDDGTNEGEGLRKEALDQAIDQQMKNNHQPEDDTCLDGY